MNELDIILMSKAELQVELGIVGNTHRATVPRRLKLARQVLKRRKDIEIWYLPVSRGGLIGPCLCVCGSPSQGCSLCRRLEP